MAKLTDLWDTISEKHEDVVNRAKDRMEICEQCDRYNSKLKLCKECGCFMPAKTMLTGSPCPLEKWL